MSNQFGQAEVEHFQSAVGANHDVAWFQIAMDDAARMRHCQRVSDRMAIRSASPRRMPWRGMSASRLVINGDDHVLTGSTAATATLSDGSTRTVTPLWSSSAVNVATVPTHVSITMKSSPSAASIS